MCSAVVTARFLEGILLAHASHACDHTHTPIHTHTLQTLGPTGQIPTPPACSTPLGTISSPLDTPANTRARRLDDHDGQYSVFSKCSSTVTVSPSGPPGLFKGVKGLLFSKGIPYFLLPDLDSVNHCTSKYLLISILISLLVQ